MPRATTQQKIFFYKILKVMCKMKNSKPASQTRVIRETVKEWVEAGICEDVTVPDVYQFIDEKEIRANA